MRISDTSSIAQHFKKIIIPSTELRKILTENTTILELQNNKQKLQIVEALHIRNIQTKVQTVQTLFLQSSNVHTNITSLL